MRHAIACGLGLGLGLALGLASILLTAATAHADRPIRLGTTGKGVDRAATEAALDGAFRAMTPCFRKASGTIEVKLDVGADGEVTSATATAKSTAAQCVAGLLAVTRFPGAFKATVSVDAVRAEQWLTDQLAKHQGALSACQDKDPSSKGEVALQLAIAKTGAVTAATVDKTTASKSIAECARTAAADIEVGALPGGADVKYRMVVRYAGGGSSGSSGSAPSTSTTTDEGGSARGALGGDVIQKTWTAQRAKVLACGAKLTKATRLIAKFAVRANGSVKNVVLADSTAGKTVDDCVDKELRALTFPTASGETQVTIPVSWDKR
jgi:hypothetical protein